MFCRKSQLVIFMMDGTYISPASLNPGPWILLVEQLSFREVQSVSIDPFISYVDLVVPCDADRSQISILVVGIDIILEASLIVPQPARPILWCRTARKIRHSRILTHKVRTGSRRTSAWWLEYGATVWSIVLWLAANNGHLEVIASMGRKRDEADSVGEACPEPLDKLHNGVRQRRRRTYATLFGPQV